MAIILDKYAIKEVADVMFYELDSKGAPSAPVLYLDTLKTSTIEQSSETVDATGGKGNVKLLSWDTNKELTLTLEDALFSAKSLGIMFGGRMKANGANQEVLKTVTAKAATYDSTNGVLSFKIKNDTFYIDKDKVTAFSYKTDAGVDSVDPQPVDDPDFANMTNTAESAAGRVQPIEFITFDLLDCTTTATGSTGAVQDGLEINVTAEFDSNTYYIIGDTYAINYQSGQDEFLQFIIPKGKVSAEDVSLTMEADGDPATFSMSVKCLKANDGSMIKLVKYNLTATGATASGNKGVASVLDAYNEASKGERDPYTSDASIISDGSKSETTIIGTQGN